MHARYATGARRALFFAVTLVATAAAMASATEAGDRVALLAGPADSGAAGRDSAAVRGIVLALAGGLHAQGITVRSPELGDRGAGRTRASGATREALAAYGRALLDGDAAGGGRIVLVHGSTAVREAADGTRRMVGRAGARVLEPDGAGVARRIEGPPARAALPGTCDDACRRAHGRRMLARSAVKMTPRAVDALADLPPAPDAGMDAGTDGVAATPERDARCRADSPIVYTLHLKRMAPETRRAIVDTLTNAGDPPASEAFPCFRQHALMQRAPRMARYEYVSTARRFELSRWLPKVAQSAGLEPGRDVFIAIRDDRIVLDTAEPPADGGSRDNGGLRFK